jgi:catechol 2,3-dioxygenase-like lactoylglutathione lyase family enzyme
MHVRGFHHLAIQVRSVEETAAWYRRVLGFTERERHLRPDGSLRSVWLEVPGTGGGFVALEEARGEPPRDDFSTDRAGPLLLALRISPGERPRALAELERLGVPVVHQTRWTVYFRDPEGNRLALSHHPDDPI